MSPVIQANTIEKIHCKTNCRSTINTYCCRKSITLSEQCQEGAFLLNFFEYRSNLNLNRQTHRGYLLQLLNFLRKAMLYSLSGITMHCDQCQFCDLSFHILVLQGETILMNLKTWALYCITCRELAQEGNL